jgi:hypothetical protein
MYMYLQIINLWAVIQLPLQPSLDEGTRYDKLNKHIMHILYFPAGSGHAGSSRHGSAS